MPRGAGATCSARSRCAARARSGSGAGATRRGRAEVTVYPDVPAARRLALAVRQGRFRAAGRLTRGPLGLGTEFESIRDYDPDDDIRQVNWRATERMQRPMSNQYRVEQDREVMLLIDAGRLMAAPLADRTRLDGAVDAAVAVALVADVLGDRAGVLAFDRDVAGGCAPRRAGGHAVVRALLDLEPRAEEPDYELAFRNVEGGKRSLVFIFCDLLEETAARPLADAVPVLARKHAVMVATVRDPDLDEVLSDRADRRARRRRAGRGARRAGRAHAREPHAPARRGAGRRGAGGPVRGRVRRRLSAGQDAGEGVTSRPRSSTSAQYGAGGGDADGDRGAERQAPRRHEALDQPGQHQPRHRAEHDLHRRARLTAQRRAARQRPGVDDRPAHPQPGGAATAMQVSSSRPCGSTSREQLAGRAVLDREAEQRADEAAVEDRHAPRCRARA